MLKVAVLQSNYFPWKGYFDIIHDVDIFVFYDEVQYTKNNWRNRNRIYPKQGNLSWLTVPCGYDINRRIDEVKISNTINWQLDHWNKINNAYSKAPFFNKYKSFLEHILFERKWEYLSDLNQFTIKYIANEFLNIETKFVKSTEYKSEGSKSEKLLSLLLSIGCDEYVSGPAAKNYLNAAEYSERGIHVVWKEYSGYPEYPQLGETFDHYVSIMDLLFNCGAEAPYYIWGWRAALSSNYLPESVKFI